MRSTWLPLALGFTLALVASSTPIARAQAPQPVDFKAQIQPIFFGNCGGGACHLGDSTSGVDLIDYASVMASVGEQYGGPIVLPLNAEQSPLWRKVALFQPEFGDRMPLDLSPLSATELDLIARWIDEGAEEVGFRFVRGDVTADGTLDITDAIRLLRYLFLGGEPPPCDPVADSNDDKTTDLSDAVGILRHLFVDPVPLPELTEHDQFVCNGGNTPPDVDPIGTVDGREGDTFELQVSAGDVDGDDLFYTLERAPDGMTIGHTTGLCQWTPQFGEEGSHFFVVRVTDSGLTPSWTDVNGRVRVAAGNRPPTVEPIETIYGREGVPVELTIQATDSEGGTLTFEAIEAPQGSTVDVNTGLFTWTPEVGQAGKHPVRCRIVDDGDPPKSSESSFTVIVLDENSPVNQPPTISNRPIYRSYTGREIGFSVVAQDPDGNDLLFSAEDLPTGASFDATTGDFSWTPQPDQLGPFYIPVTVTDSGLPPESAEDILVFKILPPDGCVVETCDPATGCTSELVPLNIPCCNEGADPERVAEPVADCPSGRVLFVGRNNLGFGRLQNCDEFPIILFAQGGANVRIHVEARCVDATEKALLRMRLRTSDHLLLDFEEFVSLTLRNDGFAQVYSLFQGINPDAPPLDLHGSNALLTVSLIDVAGVTLHEELRVRLTIEGSADLPDPDVEDIPAGEVGCLGCHRPLSETGERAGIEDAHPWAPLSCVDCHGGNANAFTRETAHVKPGLADPTFLRNLSSDQLDEVSTHYLRFVNPGDLRVASTGCGSQNPASQGTGCHQRIVDTVPMSVMSTYAGHYSLPRFLAGSQDREPIYAAVDVENPFFDEATAPEGAIPALQALREPELGADRSTISSCMDTYIPKACPTCHLNDFGRNDSAGNFRSSGCTACHMVYDDDGLSRSIDPMINKDFPSHPIQHQLTTAIPTEQCAHCHFQGGRIGLAYRGIREGGFAPEKTPPDGETLGVPLHAHDKDYYFSDEDITNFVDETPPDVHHTAGMACADCHVGGDVHGDGNLYSSERYQVGIRCEDCHGTVRAEATEDPEDGLFKNSKGFALRHVRRTEDDRIMLKLHTEDREIEVPQIHRILESGVNPAMTEAMGVNESGFSHADSLECYSCHTSWRQTCFGCHITIDDSAAGTNQTTGDVSQGAISVERRDYALDFFALGVNQRGKITPLCSSMSVFMSYRDENGNFQYRDALRTSGDGRLGFGWNPFHHHTVSRVPQNCNQCHPVSGGAPDNTTTLNETYGFGSGRFTFVDNDGVEHDLTAFLDNTGALISEFPHPNTGPVPAATREKAMSVEVVPQSR